MSSAKQICSRLFVYGTLLSRSNNVFARGLREVSNFEGKGRIQGRLYRVASYPGWKQTTYNEWVTGEIYSLFEPRGTLLLLDEYEGEDYRRVLVEARIEGSPSLECWAYEYLGSVTEDQAIPSGQFTP